MQNYFVSTWIPYLVITSLTSVLCSNWRKIELLLLHISPPNGAIVFQGSTVNVYCGSTSPVNWTFHHNYELANYDIGLPISNRHIKGDKNITLVYLKIEDTGDYYCHGLADNHYFISQIYIEVVSVAIIGEVIPNWVEVKEGSSVTLTCGSVKPVEWFSVNIEPQNKTIQGNTITLHNLKKEHSGRYLCRGIDGEIVFHISSVILVDSYVVRVPQQDNTYQTIHDLAY